MADDQTQPQTEETLAQTIEPVITAETPLQEQPTPQENPQPEENTQTPTSENTQPETEPQPTQNPEAPTQPANPPVENPSPETVETTKTDVNPPTDTSTPTVEPEEPKESTPTISIPQLHYPFSGNFAITFAFGAQSDSEEIKKKFSEWGITGHNGLDFGLAEGTEVYPCDNGKIIQSGENGDFGNSVTLEHSWGTSLYAHLKETKVNVGDNAEVNKVIGLSGKTGAAFGEHLHFAIKPNNPDLNNGYIGFIDPSPYLSSPSQKEETKQETVQAPPVEEQKPQEETKPSETTQPTQELPVTEIPQQPPAEIIPPPIELEPEKPTEQTEQSKPQESEKVIIKGVPVVNQTEVQRQVEEKLKTELDLRRQKANETRQTKREENLMKIEKLIQEKKEINNNDVCDLLHISQSTATNYLADLVKRGTIKLNGKGKATTYSY